MNQASGTTLRNLACLGCQFIYYQQRMCRSMYMCVCGHSMTHWSHLLCVGRAHHKGWTAMLKHKVASEYIAGWRTQRCQETGGIWKTKIQRKGIYPDMPERTEIKVDNDYTYIKLLSEHCLLHQAIFSTPNLNLTDDQLVACGVSTMWVGASLGRKRATVAERAEHDTKLCSGSEDGGCSKVRVPTGYENKL